MTVAGAKLSVSYSEIFPRRWSILEEASIATPYDEARFVDIQWGAQRLSLRSSGRISIRDLWLGAKQTLLSGGSVHSGEEHNEILEKSALEWKNSTQARTGFYDVAVITGVEAKTADTWISV
ncbi:hypothetical protein D9757_007410 [Collybiopsis confluens]|uniref:Uncharacterized protein n=1 Tax=Collybiopsis confluens TaxID=2823264 RepID=A0A8H5HI10_9AGAR|nr:hypothetical protein D9757_007410 [Collybiopsis confluens]